MRLTAMFCAAWMSLSYASASDITIYPRPQSESDTRNVYALELLQLALHEAGATTQLVPSDNTMTQERALSELEAGKRLQVMWAMTTREREQRALAIRVPIYKGLIGWRLALVHVTQSDLLSQVQSVDDLATFTAGLARDWPDVDVLRANHLKVITASGYENLFSMLGQKRFDYMPRSIGEIWDEAEAHRADGMLIDPYIVIHYPAAVYFFVNKSNPALAQKISLGLYRAIQNGKFDRLFYAYHTPAIEYARLNQRRVIELSNPSLPQSAPLDQSDLWLRLPRTAPKREPAK